MNWNIIGHEWAVEYLQHSIAAGHGSHAYIISGPEGVGKTLLALRLSQVLNCEKQAYEPCFACRTCLRIERGNHPDVRIASMQTQAAALPSSQATRQKELKIDTIRQWQRDIALKPYEGRHRIFLLYDADRLNEEASNAMLKTLEEPPPFAVFILVANTANLLPTIVSRCQPIRLRPLPRHQVARALIEHQGLDEAQAILLAAWSGGRIGWAFRMAASPEEVQAYQARLDEIIHIQKQPYYEAFQWAEERSKEYRSGEQELVFAWLELWQNWWHDVLLVAAGCAEDIMHADRQDDLQRAARSYHLAQIHHFMVRVSDVMQQLRENVNPQLALENLFLHLPEENAHFSGSMSI